VDDRRGLSSRDVVRAQGVLVDGHRNPPARTRRLGPCRSGLASFTSGASIEAQIGSAPARREAGQRGSHSGRIDRIIGVGTNVGLAYPPLVLLLAVAAVLRRGLFGITFALALRAILGTIRATSHALALANVVTPSSLASSWPPAASRAARSCPTSSPVGRTGPSNRTPFIVAEASLSFLGLGIPPSQQSWET
jgi:peptide/nickel transport system permease protein